MLSLNLMNTNNNRFVIDAESRSPLNLRELWEFRELLFFFAWRDIKVKYKQTFLGVMWAFIQPLLMMWVFTVFFGNMLHFPSDNLPYPVFAFTGLIVWNIFSAGVVNSSNSMMSNAVIIKKNYFPRIILPLSGVIVSVFDFLVSFLLFSVVLAYYRVFPPDFMRLFTLFPAAVVIAIITTIGSGVLIGALNIRFRDFRIVLPFFMQLLLFITPVIYPISGIANKQLYYLLSLNPMAGAIGLARAALNENPIDWTSTSIGCAMSLLILLVGLFVFKKNEAVLSDLA